MPKMKTRRAASKRYKVTANKKIKIKKSNLRHILTKKDTKLKRKLRQAGYVAQVDMPLVRRCLPYM